MQYPITNSNQRFKTIMIHVCSLPIHCLSYPREPRRVPLQVPWGSVLSAKLYGSAAAPVKRAILNIHSMYCPYFSTEAGQLEWNEGFFVSPFFFFFFFFFSFRRRYILLIRKPYVSIWALSRANNLWSFILAIASHSWLQAVIPLFKLGGEGLYTSGEGGGGAGGGDIGLLVGVCMA